MDDFVAEKVRQNFLRTGEAATRSSALGCGFTGQNGQVSLACRAAADTVTPNAAKLLARLIHSLTPSLLMARKGKWIDVAAAADRPVSEGARHALQVRLGVLWQWLPLAARQADDDLEHVHQLRVASRRAVATLQMFSDVLPPRRARWMLKQLKKARKAAGAARDDDVLALRLEEWQRRWPDIAPVLEQVRAHRRRAQAPVKAIYRKLRRKRFEQRTSHLLKRLRWRNRKSPEPTLAHAARENLRRVWNEFQTRSTGDFSDIESLHEFRIVSKRLRYAMELFATTFAADFRKQLYPQIVQLQELLGRVNDHAVACARLEAWLVESEDESRNAALAQLLAAESSALVESRAAFIEHWTSSRAAAIAEQFHYHLDDDARIGSDGGAAATA